MLDTAASLGSSALAHLPTLVLAWLAFFFGRTLRAGAVPLVERIARVSKPDLSPALGRYTRTLTAVWSVYFAAAAALVTFGALAGPSASVGVASISAAFFVAEHWVRRTLLFREERFPGLLQQLRDTVSVWRPAR